MAEGITRHFHPVLAVEALGRDPVRVELGGQAYVLFRSALGRPAALLDVCPHRLVPLSAGRVQADGRLSCRAHGWSFDAEGRVRCPSAEGSARDAQALQVIERHGLLWLADRETSEARFPRMYEEGLAEVGTSSQRYSCPLHVLFSRFVDVGHARERHASGVGALFPERVFSALGEVETTAEDGQVRTVYRWRAPAGARDLFGDPLDLGAIVVQRERVSRFDPLRLTETLSWHDEVTGEPGPLVLRVTSVFVPETPTASRVHRFAGLAVRGPRLRRLAPLLRAACRKVVGWTTREDPGFLRVCAGIPFDTEAMHLGKRDEPVVANLEALRRSIYFREACGATSLAETWRR